MTVSRTLDRLVEELVREVTTVKNTVVLSATEDASPFLNKCGDTVHRFVDSAGTLLHEVEQTDVHNVHRTRINEMKHALKTVADCGNNLEVEGKGFIADLFSSKKREEIVGVARDLLDAIAQYLLLADKLDVFFIIEEVDVAKSLLRDLRSAKNGHEVLERYSTFMNVLEEIDETTRLRLAEVCTAAARDDLMAARSLVKSHCPLVFSTTKAAVAHPAARNNCAQSHAEMEHALEGLQCALRGDASEGSFASSSLLNYGRLAAELELFQNRVYMDSSAYRGDVDRADLEEILERIVTGSAKIADEASTRTERKHKIINECNNLRQALQDLLKEYERNRGRTEPSEDVDLAMVLVGRKQKDLKRHLRRAIVDNVGDAFLDQQTPLLVLIHEAKTGDMGKTREAAEGRGGFAEHAERLVYVARLACEMSTDQEGIRLIKYTTEQMQKLAPQVIGAAYLLCENTDSDAAKENMEVFSKTWQDKVSVLTMAVDSLLSLDDFLAVSEAHIVEDATCGIQAVHEGSGGLLDSAAGAIRGRSLRVCQVVDEEMHLEGGEADTENVKTATAVLREEVNKFAYNSEALITKLEEGDAPEETSANVESFTESCKQVLESVKRIRNALLVNRNPEDVDSDNEYEDDGFTQGADQKSTVSDLENQQRLMRRLPEEDKKKIQEQIDVFKIAHTKFEREVAKWDETGNDIIVLAKHMCMIMTNMTDFTRGRGPLKSTMDVIKAAQEISTAGQKLNVLARQIGDEAEEGNAKNEQLKKTNKDLHSYLSKMTLFCQQLNICSKVKADVQQVGDELVVSGLDSATSLIQTARNLLNAVVATVKNAYIISTKFRTHSGPARVEWKMTRPRKQPLVPSSSSSSRGHGIVRRASEKRPMPMQALSEFTRP